MYILITLNFIDFDLSDVGFSLFAYNTSLIFNNFMKFSSQSVNPKSDKSKAKNKRTTYKNIGLLN